MASSAHSTAGPRSSIEKAAVFLAMIFQIAVTFLPSLGLGTEIGDQSDSERTLITPAGWAFAIWGPLYTGTAVFAIYQMLGPNSASPLLRRVAWPAAGAFAGNGLWALYVQLFGLTAMSSAIILLTLVCLLAIYRTIAGWPHPFTRGEQWCVVLPLSGLAAWLTAAAIVNVAASLKYHGVDAGTGAAALSAAIVVVGGLIAAAAVWRGRGNPWYALVFLWALSAIYAAGGQQESLVAVAAIATGLLVIGAAVRRLSQPENAGKWFGAGREPAAA